MSGSAQKTFYKPLDVVTDGFTLVELLIVVGLISVMTGAIIPSFSSFLRGQNVKQSQEQVKNDLRTALNKALTGTASNDVNVEYWGMAFVGGQTNYSFFTTTTNTNCLPGTGVPDNKSNTSTSSNLVGGVTIGGSNNMCVYYSLKNGDVNFVGSFPACNVSLTGLTCISLCDTSGSCKQIGMNSVGLVRVEN